MNLWPLVNLYVATHMFGDDNSYEYGEKYYDADGHEITKEEYEDLLRRALVKRPTD